MPKSLVERVTRFLKGDTLRVTLDCTKWRLTFENLKGKVGDRRAKASVSIEKGKTYYPAIDFYAWIAKPREEGGEGYDFRLVFD